MNCCVVCETKGTSTRLDFCCSYLHIRRDLNTTHRICQGNFSAEFGLLLKKLTEVMQQVLPAIRSRLQSAEPLTGTTPNRDLMFWTLGVEAAYYVVRHLNRSPAKDITARTHARGFGYGLIFMTAAYDARLLAPNLVTTKSCRPHQHQSSASLLLNPAIRNFGLHYLSQRAEQ